MPSGPMGNERSIREVCWTKTKVQAFGGLLGDTVQSVHACGEDIEVLESFTYLASVVHNNGGSG